MRGTALFVGIGSPHGDDRAGWLVADALAQACAHVAAPTNGGSALRRTVTIRKAGVPADLLDWMEGAATLIVCDAVRGAGMPGTLHQWRWPDAGIERYHSAGSHDLGLSGVLELAEKLGRLPPEVIVWGIEIGPVVPAAGASPQVLEALPDLVRRIWSELFHA
jgi:hydrogenase maturation protease